MPPTFTDRINVGSFRGVPSPQDSVCFIKKYISDSELAQDPLLVMTHVRATNMSLVPESKILIFIGCEYTLGLGSLESFYLTISNLDTSRFGYFPYFPMLSFFIAILNLVFLLLISMPHQERQQPYTIGGIEMERFGTCCCILLRREVQEECWLSRAAFQQFHLAKCRTQTFALAFGTSSSRECPCSTGDAPCCFEFLGTGHAAQGGLWRQQKHLAWKDGAVKGNMIVFLGTTIAPK